MPGVDAIRSTIRNAVESDPTDSNNASCSRTAPRSDTHSPPSASITARSRITRPGSCPRRRSLTPASRRDNAPVSPTLSATSALPACDTKPAPSALTSTVTGRPLRITFTVNLQARDQGPSTSPRIPAQPDVSAPPPTGGAGRYCTLRAKYLAEQPTQRLLVTTDEPRDRRVIRHHVARDHPIGHILPTDQRRPDPVTHATGTQLVATRYRLVSAKSGPTGHSAWRPNAYRRLDTWLLKKVVRQCGNAGDAGECGKCSL
jgi:hypothetical protein